MTDVMAALKAEHGAAVAMLAAGIRHHVREEQGEVFRELKRHVERERLARIGAAYDTRSKTRSARVAGWHGDARPASTA